MKALAAAALFLSASPALATPLYNTPVYDPSSKSYFEMIDTRGRTGPAWTKSNGLRAWIGKWGESEREATTLEYHGVRGRLALMTSVETYDLLVEKFQPDTYVWVGYRYDCATHRLIDSTGHDASHQAFQPWAKNWRIGEYFCQYNPYINGYGEENGMPQYGPIALSPIKDGALWIGQGWNKGYEAYLVEFPTGKP